MAKRDKNNGQVHTRPSKESALVEDALQVLPRVSDIYGVTQAYVSFLAHFNSEAVEVSPLFHYDGLDLPLSVPSKARKARCFPNGTLMFSLGPYKFRIFRRPNDYDAS